ncbi:MAG: glycolate oxidase subunit GlcE [Steroidobacteraceae bacterium]
MADRDATAELVDRVRDATARRVPLRIVGGDTKEFLGRILECDLLELDVHSGIVSYDPAELVITARGGTRLDAIVAALGEHGQRLPFEPPSFGDAATLGGTVACGLSGPARAFAGPLRDYVLGARVLAGDGRVLRFGGEVMKNVAGYDVARTMAGAFGTLGVLLDVSLKVLPAARHTRTLALAIDQQAALAHLEQLARTSLPLSASSWTDGVLWLRFEGSQRTLDDVQRRVGGEVVDDGDAFWTSVREHTHRFFATGMRIWRLHVPASAPPLPLPAEPLIEWNGMQRWYALDSTDVRDVAVAAGGHATLFRNARPEDTVFERPSDAIMRLHRSLKAVFDPAGILNPDRMYPDL